METQQFLKKLNNIFANLSRNPNNDVVRVVGKEFGYLDLPQAGNLSDLANLEPLYRGFREKLYLEEFLFDGYNKKFFIGSGAYGRGFYASRDENIAKEFTGAYGFHNDRLLKFYIKDYSMIDFEDLQKDCENMFNVVRHFVYSEGVAGNIIVDDRAKLFVSYVCGLTGKKLDAAFALMQYELSAMAIILGYDIIDLSKGGNQPNYLILNRSKVHVLNVDYERILGQSKRYKRVAPGKLPNKIAMGE